MDPRLAAFAVLEGLPLLQDLLIGVVVGTVGGKLVVARKERLGRELSSRRVRQIELVWMGLFLGMALVLYVLAELR